VPPAGGASALSLSWARAVVSRQVFLRQRQPADPLTRFDDLPAMFRQVQGRAADDHAMPFWHEESSGHRDL
jgi:hypothetical protein